jgi:hypothetical protein
MYDAVGNVGMTSTHAKMRVQHATYLERAQDFMVTSFDLFIAKYWSVQRALFACRH